MNAPARPGLPALPHPKPPHFVDHQFEKHFTVAASRDRVWAWLNDPTTFTDGQIFPYRVEFLAARPGEPAGFHEGGVNIHHGPLLGLAGRLTEIREGVSRELDYFYGSYVGSLRWIRPTRLSFRIDDAPGDATDVVLRLQSYVHPRLSRLWTLGQRIFWSRFPRWMARSLEAK